MIRASSLSPRHLTPRQRRQLLDAAIVLAILSVAWALAGLVWRIAGHAGTGAVTVPPSARVRTVATDVAPALALAPFGRAALADAAQPTGIQAVLKGVIFARPAELSTAFVAIGSEPARPLRIGEALAGAVVEAIQRDRILLNNGGRIEYLAFPDPFAGPVDPNAPAPAVAAPGAAPAPATPPPSASPADLAQRLGATQVPGGLAIGATPPPGLRQGDVIQSVNGTQLTDPAAAQAALANARGGPVQVTIVRDGRPVTVTVPLP